MRLASQLFSVGGVVKPALQAEGKDGDVDGDDEKLAGKAKAARQGGDEGGRREATWERYKRLKGKLG